MKVKPAIQEADDEAEESPVAFPSLLLRSPRPFSLPCSLRLAPPPPLVVSLSCNHISQAPSPSRPPLSLLLASYSTLNIQDLPCFDPPRAFSCLTPPSRPSISLRCALDSLSPSYTTPERPSLRDTRKVRVYTTSSSTDDPATPDALPLASVPPRNDSSLVAAKRLPGSAGSRRSPLSEAVNIY